jgi:hypothetical protein
MITRLEIGLTAAIVALGAGCCAPPITWPQAPARPPVLANASMTEEQRGEFYHLAEGSEIVPLVWLFALENDEGRPFVADLGRYGFLPEERSPADPLGLPVGLAVAVPPDMESLGIPFVGINCAACHVGQIAYGGRDYRIEGGPNLFDVERFSVDLARAARRAFSSPGQIWGFLGRVLAYSDELDDAQLEMASRGAAPPPHCRRLRPGTRKLLQRHASFGDLKAGGDVERKLAQEVEQAVNQLPSVAKEKVGEYCGGLADRFSAKAPEAEPEEIGSGRDALMDLGEEMRLFWKRIEFLEQFGAFGGTPGGFGRTDAFGITRNFVFGDQGKVPPTAPICYPHLWGFAKTRWLHWNANTTSVMERNIGQAIGLGAILDKEKHTSTVLVRNLHRLETLARTIQPPAWPASFPPIDEGKRKAGEAVYQRLCADCHDRHETVDGLEEYPLYKPDDIGTDPGHAMNFDRGVGLLFGRIPGPPFVGELGSELRRVRDRAYQDIPEPDRRDWEHGRVPEWRSTKQYPARPLAGIWASPPYLHNGSVPTLDALLRPSAARPAAFAVGDRTYDPAHLGYVLRGAFRFDAASPGNSNHGHEGPRFGTDLGEDERAALLEFLKTK